MPKQHTQSDSSERQGRRPDVKRNRDLPPALRLGLVRAMVTYSRGGYVLGPGQAHLLYDYAEGELSSDLVLLRMVLGMQRLKGSLNLDHIWEEEHNSLVPTMLAPKFSWWTLSYPSSEGFGVRRHELKEYLVDGSQAKRWMPETPMHPDHRRMASYVQAEMWDHLYYRGPQPPSAVLDEDLPDSGPTQAVEERQALDLDELQLEERCVAPVFWLEVPNGREIMPRAGGRRSVRQEILLDVQSDSYKRFIRLEDGIQLQRQPDTWAEPRVAPTVWSGKSFEDRSAYLGVSLEELEFANSRLLSDLREQEYGFTRLYVGIDSLYWALPEPAEVSAQELRDVRDRVEGILGPIATPEDRDQVQPQDLDHIPLSKPQVFQLRDAGVLRFCDRYVGFGSGTDHARDQLDESGRQSALLLRKAMAA